MTFAEWIKGRRADKGQSRPAAAREIGVCANTLKNWENARTFPATLASLRGLVGWSEDTSGFVGLIVD